MMSPNYPRDKGVLDGPADQIRSLDTVALEEKRKHRPICKFYSTGSCAAGGLCPFEHTTEAKAISERCLFYNGGSGCKYGGGCVFKHDDSNGSPLDGTHSIQNASSNKEKHNSSNNNGNGSDSIGEQDTKAASPKDFCNMEADEGGVGNTTQEKRFTYSQLASMNSSNTRTGSPKTSAISSQVNPDVCVLADSPHRTTYLIKHPSQSSNELCVFAVTGKCRYGPMCRNVHGLQCPRCLLYCLHPTDLDQNEEHIQECLEKPVKSSNSVDEDIECGICLERVLSKPDPRFGLLNCPHSFCLSCIRQWRASSQSGGSGSVADPATLRSCPLCRVVTYFIVPSSQYIHDDEEKTKVIEAYKRKVQAIPCKHWDYGRGRCPFGSSCFYSHIMPDGSLPPIDLPRSYVDANEQVKVIRDFRLSDFLPPSSQRSS